MRFLILVLLVVVCIECGRRAGKKNKGGGKKNRNDRDPPAEKEEKEETIIYDEVEVEEEGEEEEAMPKFCRYTTRYGDLTLDPGMVYQFNLMDECEVVQCLEGGVVEKTRVPVNPNFGDYTLHELQVYNPSGLFAGKPCKACLCIDGRGKFWLSCQNFADKCKNPINGNA